MGFGQQSMKATKEFGQWITFKEEEGKSMRATEEFGQSIGYTTTRFALQITFKE